MPRPNPRTSAREVSSLLCCLALALPLVSACGEEPTPSDSPLQRSEDADQDGILDLHEGSADADLDGVPNYQDADSDGDAIPDRLEAGDNDPLTFPLDADGDGKPDFLDTDSDNNGLPDVSEVGPNPLEPLDADEDGVWDQVDPDNDGDLISDALEIVGVIPVDTDGDAIPDYYDLDSDGDRIPDRDEAGDIQIGDIPRDFDGDERADYRDTDADGDGLSDELEAGDRDLATAPRDTDGDGSPDYVDLDSDGDALSDSLEGQLGTEPTLYDTDGDGASDGVESLAGSDPRDRKDVPPVSWVEVPQRATTSGAFTFHVSIGRADVAFLLDNTGSMGGVISSLASNFAEVVTGVRAAIPDAAFAVSTFQDYPGAQLGGAGVKPFVLTQQLTDDDAAVQDSLNSLSWGGGSGPTSAFEALFQGLSGQGYDQDCDLVYDSSLEVPPFLTSSNDAFGGNAPGAYSSADPSTGSLGGYGFRPYSLPVIIYATDVPPRDPAAGDAAPKACDNSPSRPAVPASVVAEAQALGARLIALNVSGDPDLQETMESLAAQTGSVADLDGSGAAEDPLVFPLASSNEVVKTITTGVTSLAISGEFSRVDLVSDEDPYGFFISAEPPYYEHVVPGQSLQFDVSFTGAMAASADDQLFTLSLAVMGDRATRLGYVYLIVVVPGER